MSSKELSVASSAAPTATPGAARRFIVIPRGASVRNDSSPTRVPAPVIDTHAISNQAVAPVASVPDVTPGSTPVVLLRRRSSVYDVAEVTHDKTLTKCLKLHADVRALTGSVFTLQNVTPLWLKYKPDLNLNPASPDAGVDVGLVNELVLVSLVALRHVISTAIGTTLMERGVPAYAAAVAAEFVAACFDVVSDATVSQLVIQRADVTDEGRILPADLINELNSALSFVMRRDVELKPAFARHVDSALTQTNAADLAELHLAKIDIATTLKKLSIETKVEHDRRESCARAQELQDEDELLARAEVDRQASVSHLTRGYDEGILELRRRSVVEEILSAHNVATQSKSDAAAE